MAGDFGINYYLELFGELIAPETVHPAVWYRRCWFPQVTGQLLTWIAVARCEALSAVQLKSWDFGDLKSWGLFKRNFDQRPDIGNSKLVV